MSQAPPHLILFRHGASMWTKSDRFAGWADVDLNPTGIAEAHRAAHWLRRAGIGYDVAYTSVLKRAIRSLWIILDEMNLLWMPVIRDWRLNERHYGVLEGLKRQDALERYGKEAITAWQHTCDTAPPPLPEDDPRHPRFDPRYARLPQETLPATETLHETQERVLTLWRAEIAPRIQAGERVLIVAHGNSLRVLVKYLDGIPDEAVGNLRLPGDIPRLYTFDDHMHVTERRYLGKVSDTHRPTSSRTRTRPLR